MEWKREYLENQSRRNNIKITGVVEDNDEKRWDDTEATVKKTYQRKVGINEIERAHRVGKRLKTTPPDAILDLPPNQLAKFQSWNK